MMFKKLYNWYMNTFLPFENPDHPLHYSGEPESELEEWIEEELDYQDMIGPNYSRQMGYKPSEYEKWGDKWYKKG